FADARRVAEPAHPRADHVEHLLLADGEGLVHVVHLGHGMHLARAAGGPTGPARLVLLRHCVASQTFAARICAPAAARGVRAASPGGICPADALVTDVSP